MSNPRADYSAIFDRPPLKLPNARIGVWVIVNVEEWDINEPMARQVLPTPQGVSVIPDIPNYSWHEYGMRVGYWRIKKILDDLGIKATVSLNASVCNSYPEVFKSMLDSDWELMGHGFKQKALPMEADVRGTIRKAIATIKEASGKAPRGWMGPGLAGTFDTPDLLAEEGIEYTCDWVMDDQPVPLKVRSGRLISLPYTQELNDIAMYVVQHHSSPEMYERGKDQFDILYEESAESVRFMAIALHPYIMGVPHRIGYFAKLLDYIRSHDGVQFMTGSEILDWYDSVS